MILKFSDSLWLSGRYKGINGAHRSQDTMHKKTANNWLFSVRGIQGMQVRLNYWKDFFINDPKVVCSVLKSINLNLVNIWGSHRTDYPQVTKTNMG